MSTAAICATREYSWQPSLYRGEQFDSDLGLYYLRARYYNPATGRFYSRDPEDGDATHPASLHKYTYADGDPVTFADPMGREAMFEFAMPYVISLKAAPAMAAFGAGINCMYEWISTNFHSWFEVGMHGDTGSVQKIDSCHWLWQAPNNGIPLTHSWPLNGNLLPIPFQDQDGKCTTGIFADPMNSDPAIKACCAAHDACYTQYQCNASSFLPGGFPGPCKLICNDNVVACILTAK